MEPQPIQQPQFVMMPVAQTNGLGVFAFFVAFVGLFIPTGIVSLLGLGLGLTAIGRSPRGFATFAVIFGLLGAALWLVIMLVVVAVGLVAAVGVAVAVAGAFVLMQPEVIEVTSDMTKVAIAAEEYEQEHQTLPTEMGALALTLATTLDPWGGEYHFELTEDGQGFDVVCGGPDGTFSTNDDIRLSRLDKLWEGAFEHFEENIDEFAEKLDRLDHYEYDGSSIRSARRGFGRNAGRSAHRVSDRVSNRLSGQTSAGSSDRCSDSVPVRVADGVSIWVSEPDSDCVVDRLVDRVVSRIVDGDVDTDIDDIVVEAAAGTPDREAARGTAGAYEKAAIELMKLDTASDRKPEAKAKAAADASNGGTESGSSDG